MQLDTCKDQGGMRGLDSSRLEAAWKQSLLPEKKEHELGNSPLWICLKTGEGKNMLLGPHRMTESKRARQAAFSTGNLQLVGTDHCAFNSTQKAFGMNDFRKIPSALNVLESSTCILGKEQYLLDLMQT
ncbi:unnamed protein product, partial [Vitis vinifera]